MLKPAVLQGFGYVQLKLHCVLRKRGGRMDGDVNICSQGLEFNSEEHTNRETNWKIAFCSIFIVCLFGLP